MKIETYSAISKFVALFALLGSYFFVEILDSFGVFSTNEDDFFRVFSGLPTLVGFLEAVSIAELYKKSTGSLDFISKLHEVELKKFFKYSLNERRIQLYIGTCVLIFLVFILLTERDAYTFKLAIVGICIALALAFNTLRYFFYRNLK